MKPIIIAGPCAVESEEQIIKIASKLKQLGIDYLRGGAFKPRTNPDDFQGLGELGIEYLIKAKQITGLPIVTELMSIEQVKKYAKDIDWDWRILASLAYTESNFDTTAVSWAGAKGLMQLMPRTARAMGVPPGKEQNPEESIKAAVKYIAATSRSFNAIKD